MSDDIFVAPSYAPPPPETWWTRLVAAWHELRRDPVRAELELARKVVEAAEPVTRLPHREYVEDLLEDAVVAYRRGTRR